MSDVFKPVRFNLSSIVLKLSNDVRLVVLNPKIPVKFKLSVSEVKLPSKRAVQFKSFNSEDILPYFSPRITSQSKSSKNDDNSVKLPFEISVKLNPNRVSFS